MKREINALGAINHNALEEYEALNEQYQEMIVQRDDVQKGIDDTTAALEELKTEMQKQFDEGFNKINENFKKLFKELFGGGRAELQMDYSECDDPLSAGVEIVACPPGKKLTKDLPAFGRRTRADGHRHPVCHPHAAPHAVLRARRNRGGAGRSQRG